MGAKVSKESRLHPMQKLGDNIFCWELYTTKNPNVCIVVNMMTASEQYMICISEVHGAQVFHAEGNDAPDFIMDEIMLMFCQRSFDSFLKSKKGVNE